MSREEETERRFFEFVGKYVLFFQTIESKIDQIILLGKGHENWATSQKYLATNNFVTRKVKRAYTMLTNEKPFNKRSDEDWLEFLTSTHSRMLEQCQKRARLIHAHFEWSFVEIGGPVIRSYRSLEDDAATFEQEGLTTAIQEAYLQEVAELALAYGQILTQCAHLSGTDNA